MRVLHVSDRASSRGGADWHLCGVIEALASRGVTQRFAAGRDDGSAQLACPVEILRGLDAGLVAGLEALARDFRPDVVHVHNATVQDHRSFCPGRGKLTLAGEVCREPMRRALCASCFTDAGYHARIHGVTEERLAALSRMRKVIVLSRYMQRSLAELGVDAAVVPPFVHGLDPAARAEGAPCVLFAGRVVAAKGVADAVEAWRRARTELPLVVSGTGAERARWEGEVELSGWLPHARMSALYRRARALVMPSRWQEPFGIVGLEALTMGVPVAAWESGGVAEWHPGGALLVRWGDVDALSEALARAIDGPRAAPPAGFERAALTDRLLALYCRES
jgi:glycosyltransferase involved in cell wall biosynthesis